MKFNQARNFLIVGFVLLTLPVIGSAQRTKPRLRRPAPRVVAPVVLVPVGTNLKVRLNDTLSSKESRVGDKFTDVITRISIEPKDGLGPWNNVQPAQVDEDAKIAIRRKVHNPSAADDPGGVGH